MWPTAKSDYLWRIIHVSQEPDHLPVISLALAGCSGVAGVESEFEGVPTGGVAANVDTTVGDNPTQTLTCNLGAGEVRLEKAD